MRGWLLPFVSLVLLGIVVTDPEVTLTEDFYEHSINLMHHLWTKTFGYNIHPNIPTEAANLRVADVGTGTG